jgi:hypothetical protein
MNSTEHPSLAELADDSEKFGRVCDRLFGEIVHLPDSGLTDLFFNFLQALPQLTGSVSEMLARIERLEAEAGKAAR